MFMHRHVYLHRTVRAIDLDLAEVFAPSILAVFGDGSPVDRLGAFADLDEYALLHQAALLGARRARRDRRRHRATGRVTREVADGWRAILLRRPRWRARARGPRGAGDPRLAGRRSSRSSGEAEPGRVVLDLTGVDARPGAGRPPTLAIERRDGGPGPDAGRGAGPPPGLVADRPAVPAGGLTPARPGP